MVLDIVATPAKSVKADEMSSKIDFKNTKFEQ